MKFKCGDLVKYSSRAYPKGFYYALITERSDYE